MVKKLNSDNDTMEKLVYDETWYEIIKSRNHIRISGELPVDPDKQVKDQPENAWEILVRDHINIESSSQFVHDTMVSPGLTLQHPNDIYIYPGDKQKAESIRQSYGTFVLSSSARSSKNLRRYWYEVPLAKSEYSWKEFLDRFHVGEEIPSNSLIIIDRYLFSPNEGMDYRNGIRNLYAILDELLPKTFSDEYQILLIFDDTKFATPNLAKKLTPRELKEFNERGLKFVVKEIQDIKKRIRSYIPTIEILTINSQAGHEIYSETHDRRLISNYFSIDATRGFSAFLPEEDHKKEIIYSGPNYATWKQKLNFESIYAHIENSDQGRTSLPIHSNENTISEIKKYISGLRGDEKGFKYICNGNNRCHISELRNRLLQ